MPRFLRVTSIVVVAFAIGACNEARDPSVDAEKALNEANLAAVEVDWDDEARIAHLKGTVQTSIDRQRAEDIAGAVVGTTGRVLNELTVQGLNEEVADDLDGQIRSALKDMVEADVVLRDRDVTFEVTNGVVTVKGDVRTAAEKSKVSEILRSAPGVKDFANALEIEPDR